MNRPLTPLLTLAAALTVPAAPALAHSCASHAEPTSTKMANTRADIVATASQAGSFTTLLAAAEAAGLVDALRADGPITVFAPTDEAFAKLPAGTIETLLKPENRDQLKAILTYHVVPGRLYSEQVLAGAELRTLQGGMLDAEARGGQVTIDDAGLVQANIAATNGVIHVIDAVMMPTEDRRSAALGLIEKAIDRGAPLYDHGQPAACADVYEVTAAALIGMGQDVLSPAERMRLRNAMRESAQARTASDRAWAMRHALDDVHASLHGQAMPTMRTALR